MVEVCAKFLISRLKIGRAMAVSLVALATATLILFLDVVFELIEARISFYIFFCSLVDSLCSLCLFSEKLGEKIEYETMMSLC